MDGTLKLFGGQVPIMCVSITPPQPHIKSDKLRVQGITSATRSSAMVRADLEK